MFPDLDSFQLGISMSQLQPLAGNLQAISQGHIESDDPPPWTSRANELDVDLVGPRDHWMVKICIAVPKSVDHWRGTSISTIFHLLGQRHHQNIPQSYVAPKLTSQMTWRIAGKRRLDRHGSSRTCVPCPMTACSSGKSMNWNPIWLDDIGCMEIPFRCLAAWKSWKLTCGLLESKAGNMFEVVQLT